MAFLVQVIHCFALASKIKSWHSLMQFPDMLSENMSKHVLRYTSERGEL